MEYNYFKFWCQKVLPLVYDDSLSYYEVLCKVRDYLNHIIDDNKMITEDGQAGYQNGRRHCPGGTHRGWSDR